MTPRAAITLCPVFNYGEYDRKPEQKIVVANIDGDGHAELLTFSFFICSPITIAKTGSQSHASPSLHRPDALNVFPQLCFAEIYHATSAFLADHTDSGAAGAFRRRLPQFFPTHYTFPAKTLVAVFSYIFIPAALNEKYDFKSCNFFAKTL